MHSIRPSGMTLFIFAICFTFGLIVNAEVDSAIFSKRFIDRPYTLPVGVHELDFSATTSLPLEQEAYTSIDIGFSYRQALSENFTLLWAPLPLGLQYQPLHSPNE